MIALLARSAPLIYALKRDRAKRDVLKARLAQLVFAGRLVTEIDHVAKSFATTRLDDLHPSAVERLDWHRKEGHEIVFVTASFDAYMSYIGACLNSNAVLATRIESIDGTYTGAFEGFNVRGEKKIDAIRMYLNEDDAETWAYGNSADDHAMLTFADHAFLVDKSGTMQPFESIVD